MPLYSVYSIERKNTFNKDIRDNTTRYFNIIVLGGSSSERCAKPRSYSSAIISCCLFTTLDILFICFMKGV